MTRHQSGEMTEGVVVEGVHVVDHDDASRVGVWRETAHESCRVITPPQLWRPP